MIRRSAALGLAGWLVLASAALGQYPQPQGPMPSTPEPPLADGANETPSDSPKPAEPGTIQPAVYNQAVPLNSRVGELPIPIVTIQVAGAETAAVGSELTYKFVVQNRSEAKAHHVLVHCPVPKNAAFVKADPEPTGQEPDLQWQVGTLEPGAVKRIEVVFKPNPGETEVRVTGRVQFDHGQVVTTRIAKPGLAVKKLGPSEGVLYDNLAYRIEVTNTGRVPVRDVQVIDQLPEGLEYERDNAAGSTIDPAKNRRTWSLALLRPGEKRTLDYRLIAKKTGKDLTSMTQVKAAGISEESPFKTSILEARLTLQLNGPEQGQAYVNQPAQYQLVVKNNGTAVLNNVRVTGTYPADVRLARASSGAQFFKDSVQWIVPKLAPDESRSLTFHLVAPNGGNRRVGASVRADRGLEQTADVVTEYQGISALRWETDGTTVATVGKEVRYTIKVTNTGSADAGNVRVKAYLPPQVEFEEKANPPFRYRERTVVFDPIQLPARRSATYTVNVTAKQKGEALFRFELAADAMRSGNAVHEKTTTISGDPNTPLPTPKEPTKKDELIG